MWIACPTRDWTNYHSRAALFSHAQRSITVAGWYRSEPNPPCSENVSRKMSWLMKYSPRSSPLSLHFHRVSREQWGVCWQAGALMVLWFMIKLILMFMWLFNYVILSHNLVSIVYICVFSCIIFLSLYTLHIPSTPSSVVAWKYLF